MPPLRKQPSGTSLTRRLATASRSGASSAAAALSGVSSPRAAARVSGNCQYACVEKPSALQTAK